MGKKVIRRKAISTLLFMVITGSGHAEVSKGWHAASPPCITQNQHGAPVVGCNISTACLSVFLFFLLALALSFLWGECVVYKGKKDKIFDGCSIPPNHSMFVRIRIIIWAAVVLILALMIWSMGIHF